MSTRASARLMEAGLLLWIVGVQTIEAASLSGMALCAAGALAAGRPTREGFVRWWPLWLFLGWSLLAPLLGGRTPSGGGLSRLVDWMFLPAAAVAFATMSARSRQRLAVVGFVVLILSCVAAALQHFGLWPAEQTFATLSWTKIPFYRVYEPVPDAPGRFMAGGLLFHRLKFANVSALGCLFALSLGLVAPRDWRALAVFAIALVSIWWFPYARAASFCLLIASAVIVLSIFGFNARTWAVLAAMVAVAIALIAANPGLRNRFAHTFDSKSNGERPGILKAGMNAVVAHPWVGVGAGRLHLADYADPGAPEQVLRHQGKAHNQFVTVAAESGLPGLACYVFLLVWLLLQMGGDAAECRAGRAIWVFFCLLSLSHDPLFHAPFSMAFVLVMGIAASRPPKSASRNHLGASSNARSCGTRTSAWWWTLARSRCSSQRATTRGSTSRTSSRSWRGR